MGGEDPVDEARLEEIWNEVWTLLEDGSSDVAASTVLRVLNDEGDAPELRYLLGVSLMDLDEVDAAIPELESAANQNPDWPDARLALAWSYFRACRFDDAREAVDAALELDADLAEAHHLRGLLAERDGDGVAAERSFGKARRLDPERFPKPIRMDETQFLEIARDAVRELDTPIQEVLEETSFFVQDVPARELLVDSDPPLDPQLLGLFVGRSLLDRSVGESGVLPNTMYLFQKNLERAAASREELEEEIRITVLHEIGHHLGWDEEELEARGLA
jgi:predicted Zn-dependent protease with MMP-like domain